MTPPAASLPSSGAMYYRHSGRFWPMGVLAALLVSAAAAVVLGAAYAYVDLYNPCVSVVTFLATGAFAFAVGGVTALALRWGRVRNNVVVVVVAVVAALLALYASWIVWLYALLHKDPDVDLSLWALVTHPRGVWYLIRAINEHGAWSMGGTPGRSSGSQSPVKGTFLWAVWAAEALSVVGIATVVGARFGLSTPYCERCDRWCVGRTGVATTDAAIDPQRLRHLMERGDLAQLAALGPSRPETQQWLRFDLHECPQCRAMHCVTVNRVRHQVNKKGQQSQSVTPVVKQLLITPQAAEMVRALGQQPVAAAVPVEAPAVAPPPPPPPPATPPPSATPPPVTPPAPLPPPPTFGPPPEPPPTDDEPPRLGI